MAGLAILPDVDAEERRAPDALVVERGLRLTAETDDGVTLGEQIADVFGEQIVTDVVFAIGVHGGLTHAECGTLRYIPTQVPTSATVARTWSAFRFTLAGATPSKILLGQM